MYAMHSVCVVVLQMIQIFLASRRHGALEPEKKGSHG
jgi:hypothetical protein